MNILHIASHEINVGDGALNSVIKSYFNGHKVDDLDVHGSERYLWESSFREKYQKIIIGGGGALSASNDFENMPMAFRIPAEKITDKMAFVAVGLNNLYRQEYKPVQVRNLKSILQRCKLIGVPFSVRDDGSAERIHQITGIEVEAVPDPGLFVQVDDSYESPCIVKGKKNIIIQLAGDNLNLRFWDQNTFDVFIQELAKFSKAVIDRYDANIVLAPHIFRDMEISTRFWNVLSAIGGPLVRKNIRLTPIVGPDQYARYFKIYKDADFVIGMRGHSVICGAGMRVPTIGIDTHPKVAGFMRKAGLEDWVIKPENFSADWAMDFIGEEFNPAIDGAKYVLDHFMEKILGTC